MVEEIPPATVNDRLDDETVEVVDIRDSDAYTEGHIPSAENVPLDDLEDVVTERDWADTVVAACYIGETSVQAARLIDAYAEESDVRTMAGGYEDWTYDLESGSASES